MLAAVAGLLGLGSGNASASVQWATDPFPEVCTPNDPACDNGAGDGYIAWGNRTAEIKGYVWDFGTAADEYTKVYFDAFAGSTKVDSDFRTANGQYRPFGPFTIGDPNLVGGIDRVRIQVCVHFPLWPYKECSAQVNVLRD